MTTLIEQARKVAELRHRKAAYDAEFDAAIAKFEADNTAIIMKRRAAIDDLVAAEKELREAGLAAFQATGDKKPGPGIEVKLFNGVAYDEAQAYKWAVEHQMALRLDAKAFEATAKANPQTVPFVTFVAEPKVMIAQDLDKVLAGVAAEPQTVIP